MSMEKEGDGLATASSIVLLMTLTILIMALILAGVLSYPIAAPVSSTTSTTSAPTSTTIPPPTTTAYYRSGSYNAIQEQGIAQSYGENVPIAWFSCTASSDCTRVLAAMCNNGAPSQDICINRHYYGMFESMHNSTYQNSTHVCPDYLVLSNITCSCVESYCTENYSFG